MAIDPRRLLTFREVARQRSFSRAAETLSLTQSAVSQQVGALERQVGARLLNRRTGGPWLTPSGERLLDHAEALAERLALAETQLIDLRTAEHSELRVGAFPSALATIVPKTVSALLTAEPGLRVSVAEGRSEELAARVRDGSLHLAVSFQDANRPRVDHPGTRRVDLFTEPMVAALPTRHRLRTRKTIGLTDLAEETWTAPSRSGLIVRACARAGFSPQIAFVSSDPLSIRAVVAAGLAVTITPRLLAAHFRGVRLVPLDGEPARRDVFALLPDAGARPVDERFVTGLRP